MQIIVALTELGVPLDDERFVKNGYTLLDNLMTFYQPGNGFVHVIGGGSGVNQMSTEQGLYGLVAAQRARDGSPSLYRMSDALDIGESTSTGPAKGEGLEGKHPDVQNVPITAPGKTFDDTFNSNNVAAIEGLAARGILDGYGDGTFRPDNTMTRAEFAATVVRALGLTPAAVDVFTDVAPDDWHAKYVGTAFTYSIVKGVGNDLFNPDGTISRQEAAVMVARAAKLCGMDTGMDTMEIRDVLAQFTDYIIVADWAQESMAFCYKEEVLDPSGLEIEPKAEILRGEIAQMIFNMLGKANLL